MLVCLDPRRGETDYGEAGLNLAGKEVCLDLAIRIQRKLQNYEGISVTITRSVDGSASAEERSRFANEQKADLFISIHTNTCPDLAATGFTSYVSVIAGLKARRIQCWLHNQIVCFLRNYGIHDMGKKNDTEFIGGHLRELRQVQMPAIALSLFIPPSKQNQLLSDPEFLDRYASCIAEGIARIYGCEQKTGA
ncbi:N-acetylmuramoyl-L-alanine amidase family protein [Lihuaxuella thermophila]|uniref:N-acetylmuramoyl-L-alanine amidase n=1 Tax=Lihuaxuella thermophila TaxID=1173111 RepID=A0A1H8CA02_9BACL|nr:N-acetylmuramoyl-L-alanine amidase [Lihuaxuella thermophila]SEM91284.1 N-acetylmuramoyl-L-alanine amidase [Lihuaxuella thermophila]